MTDKSLDENEVKRKGTKAEPSPLFDAKARGAALRAAFLKAAHPAPEEASDSDEEPAPKPDEEPVAEPNVEPDPKSEPLIEPEGGLASKPAAEPTEIDADENLEAETGAEATSSNVEPEAVAEQALKPSMPDVTETSADEEDNEASSIKPQIERELFAEYVIVDDDDDSEEEETQEPEVEEGESGNGENVTDTDIDQDESGLDEQPETEPDGEPEVEPESEQAEKPETKVEAEPELEPEEKPEPMPEQAEKPVPAPVPIIEEVQATVIEKPEEPSSSQVVVAPKKLGFFARLKLLFFGGKKK